MARSTLDEQQRDAEKILPIYIVIDRSLSMGAKGKSVAASEIAPSIVDVCLQNPFADERARFTILSFNEKVHTISTMERGSDLQMFELAPDGTTSFEAVFTDLRTRIEQDFRDLESNGYKVFRASVFLITDGEPNCPKTERELAYKRLIDRSFARRPNISVFGVGQKVSEKTLVAYTSGHAVTVIARDENHPAKGLESIIELLMRSFVGGSSQAPDDNSDFGGDGFIFDEEFLRRNRWVDPIDEDAPELET